MALALGVHASAANTSGTTVATSGIATTTGSGVVVGVCFDSGVTFTSITDNKSSNVWTIIGAERTITSGKTRMYYCASVNGGAGHTFTLTVSGASTKSIWVAEITTTNLAGILLDQTGSQNDASTPFVSPSVTTTIATELLYGFTTENLNASGINHTAGASFTIVPSDEITDGTSFWTGATATRNVSSTGSYATSWTVVGTPGDTAEWIATFSEVAGGGGGRTTKNTRGWPLGTEIGMNWRGGT